MASGVGTHAQAFAGRQSTRHVERRNGSNGARPDVQVGAAVSGEVWFARNNDALIPTDEDGLKAIRRLEQGECGAWREIGVRDPVSFRLYWGGFMTPMAKYLDEVEIDRQKGKPVMYPLHREKKRADTAAKLGTKHFTESFVGDTGYSIRTPDSISYEKMSPADWDKYLPKVMEFLLEMVTPYIEVPEARDDMMRAIERWQPRMQERVA